MIFNFRSRSLINNHFFNFLNLQFLKWYFLVHDLPHNHGETVNIIRLFDVLTNTTFEYELFWGCELVLIRVRFYQSGVLFQKCEAEISQFNKIVFSIDLGRVNGLKNTKMFAGQRCPWCNPSVSYIDFMHFAIWRIIFNFVSRARSLLELRRRNSFKFIISGSASCTM